MTKTQQSILLVLIGAAIAFGANSLGLWWIGYIVGAGLALWIRPSLAGCSVVLGWIAGFAQSAVSAHLVSAARVVALLAGLPATLGLLLVAIALILAFLEGWLPALIIARIRTNQGLRAR
ncbi:hypothetical protein [Ferrimicrobium sp.]|uniref:hypothetical protein n=1 Tax=Ferrimicrobium sp. TaxID=2926050 RepID=UPI00261C473D|nr:hypothetical protein [Ferrimicrobium sp.]